MADTSSRPCSTSSSTRSSQPSARHRARVPAGNMIGGPGEGWRVAMTIVSHEREPGELGYVARYAKTVKELEKEVRADPNAFRSDQREAVAWAHVQAEMLRLHVCRRLSERLDGVE